MDRMTVEHLYYYLRGLVAAGAGKAEIIARTGESSDDDMYWITNADLARQEPVTPEEPGYLYLQMEDF